jgi:short subunit dehydrogenase-like uncharacterized protein
MTDRPENIILYGSYGYTGSLIAMECRSRNLNVILAGRNHSALYKQSKDTGFSYEVVNVNDRSALRKLLQRGGVVIHCGGPFRFTAHLVLEACLETGTHYTDITGEYAVFEKLAAYHERGLEANVTILPGTGFDVVPSDCLALHLKNRLPSATHLQLAFAMSKGGMSRGTSKTMVEGLGHGSVVRRDGQLTSVPLGEKTVQVDFGAFAMEALNIPWGDVSTAWRTTGIPNIEVFMGASEKQINLAKKSKYVNWLVRQRWIKDLLLRQIDRRSPGPSTEKRESGRSYLWGKVWDESGKTCTARLETVSGYKLTALTSTSIAARILSGEFKPGYQTPAAMFGPDLILEIENTRRTDL